MKKQKLILAFFLTMLTLCGCSGAFWGGAGTGTVGTGAAYEINAKRQIDRIDKELREGKITQQEHDIRLDQIKRGSLLQ